MKVKKRNIKLKIKQHTHRMRDYNFSVMTTQSCNLILLKNIRYTYL